MQKKSFALGYSLVGHSLLTYLFYAAAASTGLNVIVPQFAAHNNLEATTVFTMNTVGAFVSCLAVLFMGKLIIKTSIRLVTTISLIVGGIGGAILMAYVHSVVGYAICTIFAQCLVHGYCYVATNTLITNWFPRKKGVVMGITTCGIMIASFTVIPWMSALGATYGFPAMMWFLGGLMILFGVASWFWVRERPEDLGLHPDNKPLTEEEKNQAYFQQVSQQAAAQKWPAREILANKTSWLLILSMGVFLMFTSGVASTTVAFSIEYGWTQPEALRIMSLTSVVGVAGSLITGALDTKIGTKKTTILCGLWIALSFAVLLLGHNKIWAVVCVAMANMTMGSIANLTPSIVASCFGRECFAQVYRIVYTLIFLVRSLAFIMLGTGVQIVGSYRGVYLIFGAVALVATLLVCFVDDSTIQQPKHAPANPEGASV